ncbi:unnamed protein product [Penicillium salamii]|uniref:Uncharacterized protein n=1 Tax=Penicillium salamii TaxID=1612424 RepID=A0A9W4JZH7_9EURO|nr:unnamed protein product [Penicillium salamii]CAG8148942.1 unnamed protein product [Penicillium salamii]CAG8150618.1 unnamed protein product [Penicillium salamii]CAG8167150.1 unnamed protein product [Penicillium salamii]CAG8337540.1 unnamed protein product [Penicillium salamii]
MLLARSEDSVSSNAILKVWRRLYEYGHAYGPKLAAVTSTAFGYLAWSARAQRTTCRAPMIMYSAAASLVLAIVPYTIIFIGPTNDRLSARAAGKDELVSTNETSETSDDQLLRQWVVLNGIRGLLPFAGGVLGLLTAIN